MRKLRDARYGEAQVDSERQDKSDKECICRRLVCHRIHPPYRTIVASEGAVLGFDFQVNDDQNCGVRDGIAKWNDPMNDSWQSTSEYGMLILQE